MDNTKNEVNHKLWPLSGCEISISGHQLCIIHSPARGSGNEKTIHTVSRDTWGILYFHCSWDIRTNVYSTNDRPK